MESNQKAMKLLLPGMLLLIMVTSCNRYKYPFTEKLPSTAEVQEGERLYMQYCQKCHPDGEAGLGPSIFYLPGIGKRFQTRHGLGVMPAFKEKVITDDELDKIVLYLSKLD